MNVAQVLKGKPGVMTIEASAPVKSAVDTLAGARVRSLVVVEDGKLAGIVTLRDLLRHLAKSGGGGLEQEVRQAMTREVATVTPDADLDDARRTLTDRAVNHLPVVDAQGAVVGILTLADILGVHLDDQIAFNDALKQFIHGPATR